LPAYFLLSAVALAMAFAGCGGNDAETDTLGEPLPTAPE
jgi:hypothetical protein